MSLSAQLSIDLETSLGLIAVAQGKLPADVYISGGRVLNVYSGEVLAQNVALYEGRIAYVGLQQTMVGPNTKTIDASGQYLAPGYVNAHDHGDNLSTPTTHALEALRRGTTTIFFNGRQIPFLVEPEAYRLMIEELSRLPIKLFFGVDTADGAFHQRSGTVEDLEAFRSLLSHGRVFGLNEVVRWVDVMAGDRTLLLKLLLTLQAGKTVEGHTAGATYDKLNALAAAGVQSCHEGINLQDVLNRLRLGMYVLLRCSSIRPDDLPDMLRAITEHGVSTSRLALVPDGLVPPDTVGKGNMDFLVAGALAAGVEPATAYQMATLNPATHFGMDGEIGGIAPRRWADILFLKDLHEPTPNRVMSGGELVVEEGKLIVDTPEPEYYHLISNKFAAVTAVPNLEPAVFRVPAEDGKPFPVIEMISNVINRRLDMALPAQNGSLLSKPEEDILHLALIAGGASSITRGFLKGFGANVGGLAVSADGIHTMIVLGHDPSQMSAAAKRVWELRGGMVIVDRGQARFELPLPIGGTMSPDPLPVLAKNLNEAARVLQGMGLRFDDLHYAVGTLTWYFLPQLRLTARGILDVRLGQIIVPSVPL